MSSCSARLGRCGGSLGGRLSCCVGGNDSLRSRYSRLRCRSCRGIGCGVRLRRSNTRLRCRNAGLRRCCRSLRRGDACLGGRRCSLGGGNPRLSSCSARLGRCGGSLGGCGRSRTGCGSCVIVCFKRLAGGLFDDWQGIGHGHNFIDHKSHVVDGCGTRIEHIHGRFHGRYCCGRRGSSSSGDTCLVGCRCRCGYGDYRFIRGGLSVRWRRQDGRHVGRCCIHRRDIAGHGIDVGDTAGSRIDLGNISGYGIDVGDTARHRIDIGSACSNGIHVGDMARYRIDIGDMRSNRIDIANAAGRRIHAADIVGNRLNSRHGTRYGINGGNARPGRWVARGFVESQHAPLAIVSPRQCRIDRTVRNRKFQRPPDYFDHLLHHDGHAVKCRIDDARIEPALIGQV